MKKKFRMFGNCFLVTCVLALCWGMLYPEYTLLPDTCRVLALDEATGELHYLTEEDLAGGELYFRILSADRDQIIFKSKLAETLRGVLLPKNQFCD